MIQVNWVAIILSAIAAMVVGMVWYGPLFGKMWMGLTGMRMTEEGKKQAPKMYAVMFLGVIVEAFILSHFIHYAGAYSLMLGFKTGVWAWLGFVAPVMLGNYMFTKKPLNLYFIDAGYALVNLVIMGAIIGMWF